MSPMQLAETPRPPSPPRKVEARPQDRVFQALRRDVLLGRLRPRERLVEEDLAARFAVGRYVVRAALDELVRIGLVARRPNRGVVVCDYDPTEIEQLYEVREMLQRAAIARMPLPAPRALIDELTAINRAYAECLARGELDEVAEANAGFHRVLFGACGNPLLAAAIEQHWERSALVHGYAIGVPALAARSHDDHAAMIVCLAAGERGKLADLCSLHMQPSLEAVRTSARMRP
jgi:DNA-binding GntR family transcriptional regulator